MAQVTRCACGWHEHGSEEELIEAFSRHVAEGHGTQISRDDAAAHVRQDAGR